MIRVIVAEDEYFARKVLIKMLQEMECEIEVVGEAESGLEVLDIMQEKTVDIVIADIRMPDMDGLNLAKKIRESYPDVSVIIETGYAEFDYAARAIRWGVSDYLTKPIKKEELESAIERVEESKRKNLERFDRKLEMQKVQYMDFSHLLENEALSESILTKIFLNLQKENWHIGVVQSRKKGLTEQEIQSVLEILEKTEDEIFVYVGYFYPKEEFIVVLDCGTIDCETVISCLRRKLIYCSKVLNLDMEAGISLGRKKGEGQRKDAADAYREAVYAINQRLLNPGRQIYYYESDVSIKQCFSQADERNLELCLKEGKVKEAEQLLNGFFKVCENGQEVSVYSLFVSLVQIINVMNRIYNQKHEKIQQAKESGLLFSFKTDLYIYRTLDEIKDYMYQIVRDVCGVENHKSSIVDDLLSYLEWNYQYEITVNDLAMHRYFVNPSYLSRLFKAETGQAFSRYLINLRMQKAAQMFGNSDLKVSDVALCVGYNDVSYFIQTFKKYYGMTPEQYKKTMI